ncbi:MAG TPA: DNA repair protein RadA [Candidatus Borkfalkia excrementavium]|uniref:DNA repair protein RadA n=1 Tax=Candidatus Borkfalkia excrementavium TaxID=2838505 RepID=A0A9D1Z6K5_9FIRM|nr:DNA repair protein RadA [Candidatus Borkfalkia excrementavium]
MAKAKSVYVCSECGAQSPQWLGRCPNCGKFGTLAEEIEETAAPQKTAKRERSVNVSRPVPLSEVKEEKVARISSGISELDNVLGGGIVPGSLVLIGGDPGIGKSTLLTEVSAHLSKSHRVLYVSAEESCSQVKMRCNRLKLDSPNLLLLGETCLEDIEDAIGEEKFVVIDSIQAVYTSALSSAAGSVGQVRECAGKLQRIAKSRGITFFIIGHVTKEGALAGPKVLEHIMDTVLYFEGEKEDNYKILRAVKNRFGSVQEVGVFEMTGEGLFGVTDYSGVFLSESRGEAAGSAVTPSETGNRCMMVEIQTLMAKTAYGLPRRMPLGIDYNKLVLLIAVLEKRCGLAFYNQDVYMNAMGGIRLNEPAVDLALCSALASAYKNVPVDKYTAVFGEVGLTGEVRGVTFAEKRVNECVKMGFKRVIFPAKNFKSVKKFEDKIDLVPVRYVNQMISKLFPEKD